MRIALTLAVLAAASPALANGGFRPLPIVADNGTDFTVGFYSQARTTDYWCAAGNYITNIKGMPDRTRVYRLSPSPRRAGQGITFTLDPARSTGETGISTFGGRQ
ncbi:MAG: hypothetical protein ACRC14_11040, partial [Paracoccaceae bacterium]